jgi:hypothetical protein
MKTRFDVGQASRLSHYSNGPLERKTGVRKRETGATPVLLLLLLLTLDVQPSTFAQGGLTPPGTPEPTMKTLQEIWDKIGALQTTANSQKQQIRVLQLQNSLLMESTGVPLAWQFLTVDSLPNVGEYTSLAFAPDGQPAISYYDSSDDDLKYAIFNGTNWQLTAVDTNGNVGQHTSLAFAADGQPAISYYDVSNLDLKYAAYDGTNWQFTIVDTNSAQYSSLAFTPSGQPAIGYVGSGGVRYAVFNGTTWQTSIADPAGGQFTSLAFTPGGQPAISACDVGDLRYAVFNGATWTNSIVDSGPNPFFAGPYSSLAFGPDGQPAIAYRADVTASINSLKFARFNGSTWTLGTVASGKDYQFPSLAFGPDGQPAIAYHETGPGTIGLVLARKGIFIPVP